MIFVFLFFLVPGIFSHAVLKDRIIKVAENVTELQIEYTFCGSDYTSRRGSLMLMPTLFYDPLAINHCCAIHDDCYDQQNGQEKCDDEFYHCLKDQFWVNHLVFYNTVKLFGSSAYSQTAKYIPIDVIQPTSNNTNINEIYLELYTACPKTRSTISSCALRFEICENNKYTHCIEKMQSCLQQVLNRSTKKCRDTLENTLGEIKYAFGLDFYYDI